MENSFKERTSIFCLLAVFYLNSLTVIAQAEFRLNVGSTLFSMDQADVRHSFGPQTSVRARRAVGAAILAGLNYQAGPRDVLGFRGGFTFGTPRFNVHIHPTTLPEGTEVMEFSKTAFRYLNPSVGVLQLELRYGRGFQLFNGRISELFVGAGILHSSHTSIHSSLWGTEEYYRGQVVVGQGILRRYVPSFSLEAIHPLSDRPSPWSVAVNIQRSAGFFQGHYLLLPETSAESAGQIEGGYNYFGLSLIKTIALGRARE
jgi:hypothetical protein